LLLRPRLRLSLGEKTVRLLLLPLRVPLADLFSCSDGSTKPLKLSLTSRANANSVIYPVLAFWAAEPAI